MQMKVDQSDLALVTRGRAWQLIQGCDANLLALSPFIEDHAGPRGFEFWEILFSINFICDIASFLPRKKTGIMS